MKSMIILVALILSITCAASVYAQTCRSDIVASTPTSRFVDNANGTVTDSATGLVWKRCSEGQSWDGATCNGSAINDDWQYALEDGSDAVFAGASDWRLPNKKELNSLIERQCVNPAINLTVFPATPASFFWSSSPTTTNSERAWLVGFDAGTTPAGIKSMYDSRHVRLVRGGE